MNEPVGADSQPCHVSRHARAIVLVTVVATAVTLVMMAGAVMAWRFYSEWRLGRIELTTDGAPVVAQVLAESSDDPIGEPFDLVTRAIVSLPAGDYRLRVNGRGRLGRTYRFAVNRGETQAHSVSIDEGRMLGGERAQAIARDGGPKEVPIPFAPVTLAIELTPGKADIVALSRGSLIRRDGETGAVVWDALHPAKPADRDRDTAHWMRHLVHDFRQDILAEPAPDLDGDGIGDLLWTTHGLAAFLALSGKDGSMLWNYAAELDGPGGPQPDGPLVNIKDKPSARARYLFGEPVMADVDHDGTPDLIATVSFAESREESERGSAQEKASGPSRDRRLLYRRTVVAVSGRSGRWLWSYPIDRTFREYSRRAWAQSAVFVPARTPRVAFADHTQWVGLDPATGRPQVGPIDLGVIPDRPVQHADFDGDGEAEILALGETEGQQALAAIDVKTGRPMWVEKGSRMYEEEEIGPAPDWPIVADLDGDGRSEIVVPHFDMMPPSSRYRGVRLLDGLTGKTRWARPMRPDTKAADGLSQIITAPDLDGDGSRDLIIVSTFEGKNPSTTARVQPDEPKRVYVDALSGKDGRPLWWWHADLPVERFIRVWKPLLWGRGPDGWPLVAVPLGGRHPQGYSEGVEASRLHPPPVIHLLEASTGREVHTLTGLTNASLADFDGDGLADLWGEVDGELRAFRGEAPEAWRALDRFRPPAETDGLDARAYSPVDFDGDGVADTLIGGVRAPGASASQTTGSHTALARSGRDGRVIWKTVLDPRENWFEPSRGESYGLTAFPSPGGDFNGDGTPDVIVQKYVPSFPGQVNRRAATLPVQLLSGRTGGLLWSAGPLPLGFNAQGYSQIAWVGARAILPGGAPDLLVRHGSPFTKPGLAPPPQSPGTPSLARISGRDGRILWDVVLANDPGAEVYRPAQPVGFDDMDGDGGLDALFMLPPAARAGQPDYELLAISLRDGKRLWSGLVRHELNLTTGVHLGDLDGDERPEVIVVQEVSRESRIELEVRAFDGRDGKVLWKWNAGPEHIGGNRPWPTSELVDLHGVGKRRIAVNFKEAGGMRRIAVLDENGKERARLDLPADDNRILKPVVLSAVDLDGDGRDEILIASGERIHALRHDLTELWSWPDKSASIEKRIPASAERAGAVIIHPSLILDGITGQPRWTGQSPLVHWPPQIAPSLLDRGDSTRPPLLISNSLGATICRVALPTTAQGALAAPRGARAEPGLARDDPRWTRALPWLTWLKGPVGPWGFLAAGGLAFLNVILPLLILRVAAGRRRYSVRALMALPVAAAVPLMVYLMLEPVLPVGPSPLLASEKRLFIVGTVAGLPIILSAALLIRSLARGRWRPLAVLAGLSILVSLAMAAVWLWFDMKSMPSIERYGRTGWYLVFLPGAYAASLLMLIGWAIRVMFLLAKRNWQRPARDGHEGNDRS